MVLGTSALEAILFDEPIRRALTEAIEADPVRLLSAANLLECTLVGGLAGVSLPDANLTCCCTARPLRRFPLPLIKFEIARQAWRRYGKDRHSAGLNFGDCFAYAFARSSGEALLYVWERTSHVPMSPGPNSQARPV